YLENLIKSLMEKYNYQYFRTPIFESTELFHRGVGETTDIVSKETYDFTDRGDRSMTLRPEGTAGVVRSFIENKLYGTETYPVKAWYYGPMFRYERPQSGRFREFYQFGVEALGCSNPMIDAEVISIAVNFFKLLGLKEITVSINSLGDRDSRKNYKEALLKHFKPHLDELCEDCQKRYSKNPLRILDCKVDQNLSFMKDAPKMIDYLNEESQNYFKNVQNYLSVLDINYEIDTNLVRGLDYYTHTVFEVKANVAGFGSQNVLCGGGRYDYLIEEIGGPATPGIGFALGMERLLVALEYEGIVLEDENAIDAYIIPLSEKESSYALALTNMLRLNGFSTDVDYMQRSIKANFKQSDKLNARFVIIIGEEEVKNDKITIKDNRTKDEYKIMLNDIVTFLDEKIGDGHEEN
ncbi:MAG: histidine--tRNA ligase, partial [Bacilli bacterium]|nr:histidine--tRNA ligase [Bacilli bacterium]